MRKIYLFLWTCLLLCIACEWHLKPNDERTPDAVVVERYDRIQALYLTTGDRSAMQQLNTRYPEQTRMLIEDVLNIGAVNDPSINIKFLHFYQDSVLQTIIGDVERIYSDMTDVDEDLQRAFKELQQLLIATSGSVEVIMDDGKEKKSYVLDKPWKGLLIAPGLWRDLENFSNDAVVMCLASEKYDEGDYIRNYEEFLNFKANKCN